jgi:hypothetical protein
MRISLVVRRNHIHLIGSRVSRSRILNVRTVMRRMMMI